MSTESKTAKMVASREVTTGRVEVHAHRVLSPNDHDTICGLDIGKGNDDYESVPLPKGAKINCGQCISTILDCRRFTKTDVP